MRSVEQNFRIGPALRSVDDPSYRQLKRAFSGNGLRPFAPAHLRSELQTDGGVTLSWVRRTRTDGDSWDALEVPLGEESEAYLLRVRKDGGVLREEMLSMPVFDYGTSLQQEDGSTGEIVFEIAQVSATYGAGLFSQLHVTLS